MSEHQDLEAVLSRAMKAEAESTRTDPAALALIRARTSAGRRSPFAAWFFRPAVAGGALAFTLVLGTLAGVNLANGDGNTEVFADPAATSLADARADAAPAAPPAGAEMSKAVPESSGQAAESGPAATEFGVGGGPDEPGDLAIQGDLDVPVDTGGPYVAILSPGSGAVVGRTVDLRGRARVFEANVIIEVSQNGVVVQRDFTTASVGAPELGDWTKVLTLAPGNYKIEAFEESMEGDGKKMATDTIWITVADPAQGAQGPSADGQGTIDQGAGEPGPVEPAPNRPGPAPGTDPAAGSATSPPGSADGAGAATDPPGAASDPAQEPAAQPGGTAGG